MPLFGLYTKIRRKTELCFPESKQHDPTWPCSEILSRDFEEEQDSHGTAQVEVDRDVCIQCWFIGKADSPV